MYMYIYIYRVNLKSIYSARSIVNLIVYIHNFINGALFSCRQVRINAQQWYGAEEYLAMT